MPDRPEPKVIPHPWESAKKHTAAPSPPLSFRCRRAGIASSLVSYTDLQVITNFTFLTGASHPEELVQQAARLGRQAIAVTDTNTLAGIVRAHIAAKEAGIQLIVGCRLEVGWGRDEGMEARRHEGEKDESSFDDPSFLHASLPSFLSILIYTQK